MSDVSYQLVEDCGLLHGMPETLKRYFDYDAFGRDLAIEGIYVQVDYDTIVELIY